MTSFLLPSRRRLAAATPGRRSRHLRVVADAPPPAGLTPAEVRLEPGNLVAVADVLGAQMFAVVDGEVTFTARSAEGEQQWRGRLGTCGLLHLRG